MDEVKNILKKSVKDIKLSKIPIVFTIGTLDNICAFLYGDSTLKRRKTLNNFKRLFFNLDESLFEDSVDIKSRVWIIQNLLTALLDEGFENMETCVEYCRDREDCTEYSNKLLDELPKLKITYPESKYLIKEMEDRLNYGYALILKDAFKQIFDGVNYGEYKQFKKLDEDLFKLASKIDSVRKETRDTGAVSQFSLEGEEFENSVESSVIDLKNRNRIFKTGIKRLNTFLSPGYMGGRLYTYIALPGGGKSTMLLKSAVDIKKYNKDVVSEDPTKRPAVLYISLENSLSETIERLFNMVASDDDIRNYTPKQVMKKLREEGQLKCTDKDNIDIIIQYRGFEDLRTDDLYGIVDDLADDGYEVVTLILDYMKLIKPKDKAANIKDALRCISTELKNLANFYNIPVITAHQLNRSSAAIINAAKAKKSENLVTLLQSDGIGDAWEIQENSDMTCVLYKEYVPEQGQFWMGFKLLKRRYRSTETAEKLRNLEFFYQPCVKGNEIKIMDDVDEIKSLAVYSLKSIQDNSLGDPNIENIQKDAEEAAREHKAAKMKKKMDEIVDFDFTSVFH